jgi:hypothetical protein
VANIPLDRSSPNHLKFTRSAPRPEDLAMKASTLPPWTAAACRRLAQPKPGSESSRSAPNKAKHSSITLKKGAQF